jgi:hypothetical protein
MKALSVSTAKIILLPFIVLSFFNVFDANALKLGKYRLSDRSQLWFEGTSTLSDFSCMTNEINGEAILDSVPGMVKVESWQGSDTKYFADAFFNIRSKSLDCGNDLMNDDMYDALKTNDFPRISFKLEKVKQVSFNNDLKQSNMLVAGTLTVAGVSRNIEMKVKITSVDNNNEYRIQSNIKINMLDYDVEPPSAMLGLIKADENLTLFLDLFVTSDQYTSR